LNSNCHQGSTTVALTKGEKKNKEKNKTKREKKKNKNKKGEELEEMPL